MLVRQASLLALVTELGDHAGDGRGRLLGLGGLRGGLGLGLLGLGCFFLHLLLWDVVVVRVGGHVVVVVGGLVGAVGARVVVGVVVISLLFRYVAAHRGDLVVVVRVDHALALGLLRGRDHLLTLGLGLGLLGLDRLVGVGVLLVCAVTRGDDGVHELRDARLEGCGVEMLGRQPQIFLDLAPRHLHGEILDVGQEEVATLGHRALDGRGVDVRHDMRWGIDGSRCARVVGVREKRPIQIKFFSNPRLTGTAQFLRRVRCTPRGA